ncbi:MAG: hypothetical protein ACRDDX_10370 [Cellulosilyticaceae bacterium]
MRKLFTLLLTATMLTASLAGCTTSPTQQPSGNNGGTTQTTPTPEITPPDDPTQLTADLTWWAFPTFSTIYAAGEYEKQMVSKRYNIQLTKSKLVIL